MPRILVIDDDESILDAVSLILEDVGYIVDTTFKGEETYRKVESFKPDLIFLDVLMSGIDGRDICKNLKKQPDTSDIPVVMISAHPSAGDSVGRFGADNFLAKPFETSDLLKLAHEYTRKK